MYSICILVFLIRNLAISTSQNVLTNNNEDDKEEILFRERRSLNFYQTGHKLQSEMSKTLDQLLGPNYNKRIRPNYGGPPVLVELNLSIRSIGPVNEKKQDFFIDCYFRQSWRDKRLAFNNTEVDFLPMNWQSLNTIWKPDTFFVNGKKSKMHKITVPNKFLRISPDGRVSYSQRLTIHARCRMHLLKFPLDSQICPLWISSYGYASRDILYQWKQPGGVSVEIDSTAQFHIEKYEKGITNNITLRLIESGFRNDSVAFLHFFFERQMGFFLLQIYTPLLVIVMCSWVAFWIVKTDAPARCGLGITTILSVTKIGFGGGKGKPQVGYPTAMDVFVIICLMSVFAALCEFAIINFISVSLSRHKAREQEMKEAEEKNLEKAKELIETAGKVMQTLETKTTPEDPPLIVVNEHEKTNGVVDIHMMDKENVGNPFDDKITEDQDCTIDQEEPTNMRRKSVETMDASTTTEDFRRRKLSLLDWSKARLFFRSAWQYLTTKPGWMKMKPLSQQYIYTNTEEALDYMDDCAKFIFPMVFVFMMLIYWTSYLYIIEDKLEMDTF